MEALLYFIFWGALIFLMMRFGCGAHIMGHKHGKGKPVASSGSRRNMHWIPPANDIDPVCKNSVATNQVKSRVHADRVLLLLFSGMPGSLRGRTRSLRLR